VISKLHEVICFCNPLKRLFVRLYSLSGILEVLLNNQDKEETSVIGRRTVHSSNVVAMFVNCMRGRGDVVNEHCNKGIATIENTAAIGFQTIRHSLK